MEVERFTGNLPPMALIGLRGGDGSVTPPGRDEGAEQGFAASVRIVHELEEAEVERQLVLRDAPMRSQPGAQQRPKTLDRVDVDLAEPIPVLVAGILAPPMADGLVLVAPGGQARVDAAWFKTGGLWVTPKVARAAPTKGFHVSRVTRI